MSGVGYFRQRLIWPTFADSVGLPPGLVGLGLDLFDFP